MPRDAPRRSMPMRAPLAPSATATQPPSLPTPHSPRQGLIESMRHGMTAGFGAGIGSSLGHTLMDSLFHSKPSPDACATQRNAFDTCLLTYAPDPYCMNEKASFKACLEKSKITAGS
jgi:hypothetical protein